MASGGIGKLLLIGATILLLSKGGNKKKKELIERILVKYPNADATRESLMKMKMTTLQDLYDGRIR